MNIAVNEGLEFGVRISALQQINEVFFFYRKSPSLKEFAGCALNLCLESIKKYGRIRENYTLDFKKIDPVKITGNQKEVDLIEVDKDFDFTE